MTSDPNAEPSKSPSIKETWIPYVVVCFTLIFALGIIVAPMAIVDHGFLSPKSKTEITASQFNAACLAYITEYGNPPPTSENNQLLKVLLGDNPRKIVFLSVKSADLSTNGELVDGWGTPYRVAIDPNSKIHVVSAGPDKAFGTPDDITNQ